MLLVSIIFCLLFGCGKKTDGRTRPSTDGKLQVIDGQLCNKKGNPVQLQGISMYNINWYFSFINEDCYNQVSNDWHSNVIRLAMYTSGSMGYCKDGHKDQIEERIDNGINYATNADMYVIIDWHILDDYNPNMYIEDAKDFFDRMSLKYKDHDNVIYEICNEPNKTEWEDIKKYANTIIPIIRNNDEDALIIVGTPVWSSDLDAPLNDPLDYDNIMYTFHFYAASHRQEKRDVLIRACEAKLPVFVTEYGVCADTGNYPYDFDEADIWWDTLNKYKISSCMWDLSSCPEGASMIKYGILKTSGFEYEELTDGGKWLVGKLAIEQ